MADLTVSGILVGMTGGAQLLKSDIFFFEKGFGIIFIIQWRIIIEKLNETTVYSKKIINQKFKTKGLIDKNTAFLTIY